MKRLPWLYCRWVTGALALMAGTILAPTAPATAAPAEPEVDWSVVETYCGDCHNLDDQAGGVAFDLLSRDSLISEAATWELAVRKLRTGMMPPAGKPRPEPAVLDVLAAQLETRLDSEHATHPSGGSAGMGRLNRAEYVNAIRDVLAFDASSIVATLPADVTEHGFDNMASALSVSPTLIDSWASAAMRIAREAVGDRTLIPTQVKYPGGGGAQAQHVEGLPLGTRGGMLVTHNFPLDAQYEIRVTTQGAGGVFNNQAFCSGGPAIVVMIDGEPLTVENPQQFQLPISAGPHTLGAALLDTRRCEGVNEFYDVYNTAGAITGVEVHGPFEVQGAGDTPSRRAIFSCYPANAGEEQSCARSLLARLATRAWRYPVAEDAPELGPLLSFHAKGTALGDFETGVQYAVARMLIDPRFLYQAEQEPKGLATGEPYAISDLELATRLSFFLWSSVPDEELLSVAATGRLHDDAALEEQVRRMLRDPKARALVDNFAAQWLKLRELDAALPQDPAFNAKLRRAFRSETELLFTDVIAQDLGVLHLFDADYTWLNEDLARHYGIDGVRGDYMRRVQLPEDSPRRGLLGQGSILTATSVANRTSPVIRGAWIVEHILGAPVPVPPPGVETDLSANAAPDGRVFTTLRDRLEAHRANPTCAACHQIMDPIGLALENFDLVGRWRDDENGHPLNTSTSLVDGTAITGPATLRKALLTRSDTLVSTITEKLLTYALGRGIEPYDMPAVRQVVHGAAPGDYKFSELVLGIVKSAPFRMNMAEGADNQVASLETEGTP
jgi:mono/diheme cytochrome c family protein